jgi:hypothetical protein
MAQQVKERINKWNCIKETVSRHKRLS